MRWSLACALLAIAPGLAQALPATESWIVRFAAPLQNITGDQNPNVGTVWKSPDRCCEGGIPWLAEGGVSAELIGRPGVVSANVEGDLAVQYESTLSRPGVARIDVDFAGMEAESRIQTDLELAARVSWWTRIFGVRSTDTFGPHFKWNTSQDFTYDRSGGIHQPVRATGAREEIKVGMDIVVAGVSVGLFVEQESFFTPGGISGVIVATHLDSNAIVLDAFQDLGDVSPYVELALDRTGYWYLTVEELAVIDNRFSYVLQGGLFARLETAVFGNLFNAEAEISIDGPEPFALKFDPVAKLGGGFLILVAPEPATGLLLAAGLLGLAARGGRGRVRG